jgi:hypothetical protein
MLLIDAQCLPMCQGEIDAKSYKRRGVHIKRLVIDSLPSFSFVRDCGALHGQRFRSVRYLKKSQVNGFSR